MGAPSVYDQRTRESRPGSAIFARVSDNNVDVELVPAASAEVLERADWTIVNDSDQTLYLQLVDAATSTNYWYALGPGDTMHDNGTDAVHGIWAANSTGGANVTRRFYPAGA